MFTFVIHPFFEKETELKIMLFLIVFFFLGTLVALTITLIKRQQKINKVVKQKAFESQIESYILTFVFENNENAITNFLANPNAKSTLFKKLAIKYCIIMHHNYSGSVQEKILEFLTRTNLIKYSRNKIYSKSWKHKVEAIRDLSTLKDRNSIDTIEKLIHHSNEKIAIESIIALIKYDGLVSLIKLKNFKKPIDDWSQALILSVIKNNKIPYDTIIETNLESKNPSLQLLTNRIIQFYK